MRLLGRAVPVVADRATPYRERRLILSVILAAARKLQAEAKAGLLTPADRAYLAALDRFVLGRGRSAQDRGAFVFGLADAKACRDPEYWSGALVHDGVHAFLQRRARRYRDEIPPCDAQIDYLTRTGAQARLIESVRRFRDSRAGQRRRAREPV